jgi:hypothetical protein
MWIFATSRQHNVNSASPARRHRRRRAAQALGQLGQLRDVALQVEFERQILKPVFRLIDFRLWV